MDPKVAGAGVAVALGMMLLLPTFNALNNSYVENVAPPPWIPPPEKIPEDFVPPEDWTPPEDWVPPEGWEPPPDWTPPEGWEPPPGYEGQLPPGGCPPPLFKRIFDPQGKNFTGPIGNPQSAPQSNWALDIPFEVEKYAVGVSAAVNYTNWNAGVVRSTLQPSKGAAQDDETAGPRTGVLLPSTQTTRQTNHVFQIIAKDEATMPPVGTYTFTLEADAPIMGGQYATEIVVAIACGGILE